ncbi:serine/threonine protein phosphatase [Acetatifactor muris]|uniref:PAP2 superfamily protein n=1 Tax=Acetatifactor muris TaxID=879566 RepID=A0A2K4ZCE2_9FIRM|nr:phosphatase PAP2 family protein [Acetatifactor muris]MCR2046311.1 serine/threonine protein phosphatase [Acetatifactor muris]SOY28121.1 PAP2 superfamily protein [Acetatifactor muris]
MNILKRLYAKYKHGIPLAIYMIIYLSWFAWLESTNIKNYQVIHVTLDDYIPFWEVFVVPYFLWFAYVAAVVVFLFFKNRQEYYKCCVFLFTGMTIFLIISTLWPNGHHLRPAVMPRDNVFTQAVSFLWKVDTPTNLWPSIHVYNSMGAHFAVMRCTALKGRKGIKFASGILCVSIILSTMLLKQHSVFDVATAIALGSVMYTFVYRREAALAAGKMRRGMKKRISM